MKLNAEVWQITKEIAFKPMSEIGRRRRKSLIFIGLGLLLDQFSKTKVRLYRTLHSQYTAIRGIALPRDFRRILQINHSGLE